MRLIDLILMSKEWLDTCCVEWLAGMPSNADSPAVEAARQQVQRMNREQVAEHILMQIQRNGMEDGMACPFGCHSVDL